MTKIGHLLDRFLPKGKFGRNVLTLAGSVALGQGLAVLASPILTRIYSATDFGHLQAYLSASLFILPIAAGRYELAIVMPEDEQMAADLMVLCLGLTTVVSVLAGAALWWLSCLPAMAGPLADLRGFLWLAPLSILGAGCYSVMAQWTLRQRNYRQVGLSKISQGVGMVVTQIVLGGLLHGGMFGLLAGDAVGRISGLGSFLRTAWKNNRTLLAATGWAGIRRAAYQYRQFPLVSSFSSMLSSAGSSVPPLLIAAWYSPQALGWFALASRVMDAPSVLIGTAISQLYTVDAARLANTNPTALRTFLLQTLRKLALIGLVPFSLLFVFAEPLFVFVFGREWSEAGQFARWLALMYYAGFVVWPVLPTLNIMGLQSWQLIWDTGRMGLTFGGLVLAQAVGGGARTAVIAYSGAMLLGYAIHPFLSLAAIRRRGRDEILLRPGAGQA